MTDNNEAIVLCKGLTKRYEEIWRGTLADAVAHFQDSPKGEITLVIGGSGRTARAANTWPESDIRRAIDLLQQEGMAPAAVARVVARLSGWSRSDVYGQVVGESD